MLIAFIGDKPSKKNVDKHVPFVGTKSYRTLLEWIYLMNIDISNVKLYNRIDLDRHKVRNITQTAWRVKFVALGNEADDFIKNCNVSYFKLPHPSGLNRQLNDKEWLTDKLAECEKWLKE